LLALRAHPMLSSRDKITHARLNPSSTETQVYKGLTPVYYLTVA